MVIIGQDRLELRLRNRYVYKRTNDWTVCYNFNKKCAANSHGKNENRRSNSRPVDLPNLFIRIVKTREKIVINKQITIVLLIIIIKGCICITNKCEDVISHEYVL